MSDPMTPAPYRAPTPGRQAKSARFLHANPGQSFTTTDIVAACSGVNRGTVNKALNPYILAGAVLRSFQPNPNTRPVSVYRLAPAFVGRPLPELEPGMGRPASKNPALVAERKKARRLAAKLAWVQDDGQAPLAERMAQNAARNHGFKKQASDAALAALQDGGAYTADQVQALAKAQGRVYGPAIMRDSLNDLANGGRVERSTTYGKSPVYRLYAWPLYQVPVAPLSDDARATFAWLQSRPAETAHFLAAQVFGGNRPRAERALSELFSRGWVSYKFVESLALYHLNAAAPAVLPTPGQDRLDLAALAPTLQAAA